MRTTRTTEVEAGARLSGRAPASALLEPADDGEPELGRAGAVDDAMVERDGHVADLRRDDLAVSHDRPRPDASDAENRDLGVIDDGRLQEAAELARARHR